MRKHLSLGKKGQILVMGAFALIFVVSIASLSVDLGNVYAVKSSMQAAADAAALAGAMELPNTNNAEIKAREYLIKNHFNPDDFDVGFDATVNHTGVNPNWFQVKLRKRVGYFFARIMGYDEGTFEVSSTAEHLSFMPLDISGSFSGTNNYGTDDVMGITQAGANGIYTWGDPFSVKTFNNGAANPNYNPDGYNYKIHVPDDYAFSTFMLEILDPGCHAESNAREKVSDLQIDNDNEEDPNYDDVYTYDFSEIEADDAITVYTLYSPDGTLIAQTTYGQSTGDTLNKWITPDGFTFDIDSYGRGDYRLNVKTVDGSAQNVFNLRAGPAIERKQDFDPNNGTSITASGALCIDFHNTGDISVDAGYVPSDAAGGVMYISHFDSDVGPQGGLTYSLDGVNYQGTTSGNGVWQVDQIPIPEDFSGGTLSIFYENGGSQETCTFSIAVGKAVTSWETSVRLVQ